MIPSHLVLQGQGGIFVQAAYFVELTYSKDILRKEETHRQHIVLVFRAFDMAWQRNDSAFVIGTLEHCEGITLQYFTGFI